MDSHFTSACPSSLFGCDLSEHMDFEIESPGAYSSAQRPQYIPHDQPAYVNQNSYGYLVQAHNHYPTSSFQHQTHRLHQRHQSTSTQSTNSSGSSGYRSSNGSAFSQWHPRSSVASTSTTLSQVSDVSSEHYFDQLGRTLDAHHSLVSPPPTTLDEESITNIFTKGNPPHQLNQEREPFQTCVSRTKRSRRSQKDPRYWCTACSEGFGEKYDWKRHEETYQERKEKFQCDNCNNVYFLDKDFVHHHQKSHRCRVCSEKQHVNIARRPRMARTGWGCGFCDHFSTVWKERCDHISWHFEKKGDTMDEWHHSQVILSLLQRPEICNKWRRLLDIKRITNPSFGWNPKTTGRAEGYPEANPQAQLQDLLEYYTPDQDAAAIANLAFRKGFREKGLPPLPPPPPVPEKGHQQSSASSHATHYMASTSIQQQVTMQDPLQSIPPWSTFLGSIPEDPVQPTNVCEIDLDTLNAAFQLPSFHDYQSFQ